MTDNELRETAAAVEDRLALLAGEAQQLDIKATQIAAEIERTRRMACELIKELSARAERPDNRAYLDKLMTEIVVALQRHDLHTAHEQLTALQSRAEEGDPGRLDEVKAEIAAELAEQLRRPVSAKARANIRQWYNITLAPDATYAEALMAKFPWLTVNID